MPSSSRRRFLSTTAAMGLASFAGCSQSCSPRRTQYTTDLSLKGGQWPSRYYDATNANYNSGGSGPVGGVQVAWRYTTCGPSNASTTVQDGLAYFERHTLDAQTGESTTTWETDAELTPTVVDGTVYARTPNLEARDATTGEVRWTYEIGNAPSPTAPAVSNGTAYAAGGSLYAVDSETGERRWAFQPPTTLATMPAVSEQTVYVASESRMLYAVDTETGDTRWETGHEQTGGPRIEATVANGLVYFVANSDTGTVRAYEPTDGSIAWEQTTGVSTGACLAVTESTIFLAGRRSDNGIVLALDAANGDPKWLSELTESNALATVSVGRENVYTGSSVGGDEASVYALGRESGELRWEFATRSRDFGDYSEAKITGVAIVDEYVFVTTSGEVYALVEQS
mgnify:CR=1 FL=1